MPGTRTAPTVDGLAFNFILVSLTWYDYTGEQRTDTYQLDADSSAAEIEAFAAAEQALSNATLWRISVQQVYNSVGDSGNALEEVWENAKDNLVFLLKDAMNNARDFYVPSPVNSAFIEGTEEIDPTSAGIVALLASILPMRSGYSVVSGRFSHRKQIGTQIKF